MASWRARSVYLGHEGPIELIPSRQVGGYPGGTAINTNIAAGSVDEVRARAPCLYCDHEGPLESTPHRSATTTAWRPTRTSPLVLSATSERARSVYRGREGPLESTPLRQVGEYSGTAIDTNITAGSVGDVNARAPRPTASTSDLSN